jgi:hypothetical protein
MIEPELSTAVCYHYTILLVLVSIDQVIAFDVSFRNFLRQRDSHLTLNRMLAQD